MRLLNTFATISMSESIGASAGPKTWHWILFIIAVGGLAIWVLPAIFKWQRRRARQTIHLKLANEGNARSRYALHAAELTGNLTFHFRLNGKPLPEQVITVAAANRQPAARHKAAGKGAVPAKTDGPNMQKTLSSAAQTGGIIAGLLATLGQLLPGSAGQSLTGIGREVRQGQQAATQVKQVSKYADKLQPKPGSSQPSAISRRPAPEAGDARSRVGSAIIEIWAQTPFVEPGEILHVNLQVQPAKPYQSGQYSYILKSRSLEYKDAPVITEEEMVVFKALNSFERFAPFMMFAAGIMVLLMLFLSLW
ncbi:MAG: hypothetical protein JXR84_21325 [Anaerolineae bacterium]|nr:hypothetical protein [Anaerolineae bacterium]